MFVSVLRVAPASANVMIIHRGVPLPLGWLLSRCVASELRSQLESFAGQRDGSLKQIARGGWRNRDRIASRANPDQRIVAHRTAGSAYFVERTADTPRCFARAAHDKKAPPQRPARDQGKLIDSGCKHSHN